MTAIRPETGVEPIPETSYVSNIRHQTLGNVHHDIPKHVEECLKEQVHDLNKVQELIFLA